MNKNIILFLVSLVTAVFNVWSLINVLLSTGSPVISGIADVCTFVLLITVVFWIRGGKNDKN